MGHLRPEEVFKALLKTNRSLSDFETLGNPNFLLHLRYVQSKHKEFIPNWKYLKNKICTPLSTKQDF